MTRFTISFILVALLVSSSFADESRSEAKTWDAKYEQLLQDRPDIRRKVEGGRATKEDIIAWMKRGGDRPTASRNRKYYGRKIQVKDPAEFRQAQEKVIFSGPQPGEPLPAFKATRLRGERAGQEYDPTTAADGKPLMLIFQDNSVVGQKGLLLCGRVLATIADRSTQGLRVSSTFLVDDPTLSRIFEYDFMHEIDNVIEMNVSRDRRDGPGAYGLNRNVAMTIIVAKEGKVLHNFALKQPMLYPDPYVLGAIAEAIGVDRPTLASWFAEDSTRTVAQRRNAKKRSDGVQSEETPRSADKTETNGEARRRQYRNRRQIEVKDPAEFAQTQARKLFSGPQPGEELPGVRAVGIRGDLKDKEFDPVADAKGSPQILVFQDESGVGLRGLVGLGRLTEQIAERSGSGLRFTSVFLGDDPAKLSELATKVDQYVPASVQMGVSQDGRDGPGAYGLNRNVSMTILIAKQGKVTHNFAFPQSMLFPDPHVLGALADVLGEQRETLAAWLNDAAASRAAMRPGGTATSGGVAARQADLRRRLGALVQAGKLTREEAADLYSAAFPDRERSRRGRE